MSPTELTKVRDALAGAVSVDEAINSAATRGRRSVRRLLVVAGTGWSRAMDVGR
jgi:hypothetical protein